MENKSVVTDEGNLNAAAQRIVEELAHHNVRFSEVEQVIEMVKEKIFKQVISNNSVADQKVLSLENKTTVEVHEELVSREGVKEIVIGPYETFQIVQDQRTQEFTGPARVLINQEVEYERKNPVQLMVMDELEILSRPLVEFLNGNFNPHCRIEITQDFIKVIEDVIGIPKNYLTRE